MDKQMQNVGSNNGGMPMNFTFQNLPPFFPQGVNSMNQKPNIGNNNFMGHQMNPVMAQQPEQNIEKSQPLFNNFMDTKSLTNSMMSNNPNDMSMPMSYENMLAGMMRMFQSQMMGYSGMQGVPNPMMNMSAQMNQPPNNFYPAPQNYQRPTYPAQPAQQVNYASRGFSGDNMGINEGDSGISSNKKPSKREAPIEEMIAHREEDLNDFYDKISNRQGKDFQNETKRRNSKDIPQKPPQKNSMSAQDTAHFPDGQEVHLPSRSELVKFLNNTYDTYEENPMTEDNSLDRIYDPSVKNPVKSYNSDNHRWSKDAKNDRGYFNDYNSFVNETSSNKRLSFEEEQQPLTNIVNPVSQKAFSKNKGSFEEVASNNFIKPSSNNNNVRPIRENSLNYQAKTNMKPAEAQEELPLNINPTTIQSQRPDVKRPVVQKKESEDDIQKNPTAAIIKEAPLNEKPKLNSWDEKPIKPMQTDLTNQLYGPADDSFDKGNKPPNNNSKGSRNQSKNPKANNAKQQPQQDYSNPFDELPVGGARGATDFETLLEEKLQEFEDNGDPITRRPIRKEGKQFLKKNSRPYLSSGLDKPKAKKKSSTDLVSSASNTVMGFGAEKPLPNLAERKNNSEVFAINKNFGNEPLKRNNSEKEPRDIKANFNSKQSGIFQQENKNSDDSSDESMRKDKPVKNFLQKGKGVGGGKGNFGKEDQVQQTSSTADLKKKSPQIGNSQTNSTPPPNQRQQNQMQQQAGTKPIPKGGMFKGKSSGHKGSTDQNSEESSEELDYEDIVNTKATGGNNIKGGRKSSANLEENDEDYSADNRKYNAGKYTMEQGTTKGGISQKNNSQTQQTPTKGMGKLSKGKAAQGLSSNKKSDSSSPKYNFNDDVAWNSANKNENELNPLKKYGREEKNSPFQNEDDNSEGSNDSDRDISPPRSNLVEKYFNKKKNPPKKESAKQNVEAVKLTPQQEEEIVKKYVNEKIEVLNTEISKFKLENERVKKLRKKHEDMLKELNQKTEEFQKKKEQETQEFEEWKEAERKKMKNEKKLAERQSKALANVPNRKEREEIENLKKQVTKLTDEMKIKDQRNKLTIERMRKQIDDLTIRNAEYQQDIKQYEQLRITKESSAASTTTSTSVTAQKPSENASKPPQGPPKANNFVSPRSTQASTTASNNNNSNNTAAVIGKQKSKKLVESSEEDDDSEKENKKDRYYDDEEEENEDEEEEDKYEKEQKANTKYSNLSRGMGYATGSGQVNFGINEEDSEQEQDSDEMEKYEDIVNLKPGSTNAKPQLGKPNTDVQSQKKTPTSSVVAAGNNSKKVPPSNSKNESTKGPASNISKAIANQGPASTSNTSNNKKTDSKTPIKKSNSNGSEAGSKSPVFLNSILTSNKQLGNDFSYDKNTYYKGYIKEKERVVKVIQQTVSEDGKIHRVYESGKKEAIFPNGVKKETFPDDYVVVHFTNNDIKQQLPDKTTIYYFAEANTTQTTFPNGPNIYKFSNNQLEVHHQDGSKEIRFSDGTEKFIFSNGEEETRFSDGTVQRIGNNQHKTIIYPNGQKDQFLPDGMKIREFPNGKIKKFYPNGAVEEE